MEAARADAIRTKLIGNAEAKAIAAVGQAEATQMRMKAKAYERYVLQN